MSHYIKRKQINFDLLDQKCFSPSSSQCSLTTPYKNEVKITVSEKSLNNERLELEKQLKQATQNEKSWRHKYKLMENERQEFENSIRDQYEKEKETLLLELKVQKQNYIDKIQSMSSSMLHLQKQISLLRHQLLTHGITEDIDMEADDSWLLNSFKEEADFIKTAHQHAMHEYTMSASHPLWLSIQKNANGLKHELLLLQAWKSTMVMDQSLDQTQHKMDDRTLSYGLKKAIFGKNHKSMKRKSIIFT
ncbi:uncharacterized protein BX664DRAFT_361251 [Halteromyces radiatus]|uniref:uncharacterized protein n=1 Tax=Halteromyces radiatus TaxID=101107 RepID=UPI00221EFF57|nr:uncharacterized protein BX664DRAFT_361251 [Halteromyces radiatus]KAI8082971.1 hypothetical protein BX664DRAFT_361251 [Halteromyces radiatus]